MQDNNCQLKWRGCDRNALTLDVKKLPNMNDYFSIYCIKKNIFLLKKINFE